MECFTDLFHQLEYNLMLSQFIFFRRKLHRVARPLFLMVVCANHTICRLVLGHYSMRFTKVFVLWPFYCLPSTCIDTTQTDDIVSRNLGKQ